MSSPLPSMPPQLQPPKPSTCSAGAWPVQEEDDDDMEYEDEEEEAAAEGEEDDIIPLDEITINVAIVKETSDNALV